MSRIEKQAEPITDKEKLDALWKSVALKKSDAESGINDLKKKAAK